MMAVENDLEIMPDFEFALFADFSVSAEGLKLLLSIDSLVLNFDALDRTLVTVVHRGDFPIAVLTILDRIPALNLRALPLDEESEAVRNVDPAFGAPAFANKAIAPFFIFLQAGQSLKVPVAMKELIVGKNAYARAHKQAPELDDAHILDKGGADLSAMISMPFQDMADIAMQEQLDFAYGAVVCRPEIEDAAVKDFVGEENEIALAPELIVSEKPVMSAGRIEMPITAAGFRLDRSRCREDAIKVEIAAYQSGQSSVVVWGPYKRLSTGKYSLTAALGMPSKRGLALNRAKGTVSLDIYSNRTDKVLAAKTLSIRDMAASGSLEVVFDWTDECAAGEVEFRLHQNSSSKIYLFGYELKLIADAL